MRVNELFLAYFYSPAVWRRNNETMAQYIIRRESEFARLKEASSETQISSNLKCMLLLLFSGLDAKEQQGILSSVNNEYDYKKVSHALRIQFPSVISRPVARRDYLGAGKGGGHAGLSQRPKWPKHQGYKSKTVFAAEDDEIGPLGEDEVYYDDDYDGEPVSDEAYAFYSEDEELDALMADFNPDELEEGSEVAGAYATLAQHRHQFKKKFARRPQGDGQQSSQSFPFKATGDITFEQRARDQRRAAVNFLKGVTQCTACLQKGHWVGDAECPKGSGKGKQKGRGKSASKSPPKKPGAKEDDLLRPPRQDRIR